MENLLKLLNTKYLIILLISLLIVIILLFINNKNNKKSIKIISTTTLIISIIILILSFILPTILNMFDIKYDSRLLVGKDIMSDTEGIVIFNDRSFLTNKGYYNEKTNKFTCFTKTCTSSYIKNKRI